MAVEVANESEEHDASAPYTDRRYSNAEVTAIVQRALRKNGGDGGISHEELVDIAAQSGIPQDQLEAAIEEEAELGEIERAKADWMQYRKEKFASHAKLYIMVNAFLFLVDWFTPGGFWFYWIVLCWGLFLALDFADSAAPGREVVERGAQRLVRRRRLQEQRPRKF